MEKISPDTLWLLLLRHLRKAGYPVEKNQLGFLDWIKLGILESILETNDMKHDHSLPGGEMPPVLF